MAEFDRSGHLIEASFERVSSALEQKAVEARPALRAAGDALEAFLKVLEKMPAFRAEVDARR